jgi:lipopolysaccharide export system permease protein
MSILQRYVVRELLGPLGLGLFVFTFVFLIGRLFDLSELILTSGVSGFTAGELILSLLPGIMSLTVPMAVLVAILLAVGRLAAEREILAIRMSGVNLLHICIPIIAVAALLSGLIIYLNLRVIPYLNLKSADLMTEIEFDMYSAIPPDRAFNLEDSEFFYDHRDPETGEMRAVTIKTEMKREEAPELEQERQRIRDQANRLARKKDPESQAQLRGLLERAAQFEQERKITSTLIVADRGRIDADMIERMIELRLTSGSIHILNPDRPQSYNVVRFASFAKGIRKKFSTSPTGEYRKEPREMNVAELRAQMGTQSKKNKFAIEFYQRFSIPLACIAFALIAIPLGVYARPTGKAVAFAISFLLILLYYGLLQYGVSLGKTGSALAPFAIFFPNILLTVVGVVLLYRMVMR